MHMRHSFARSAALVAILLSFAPSAQAFDIRINTNIANDVINEIRIPDLRDEIGQSVEITSSVSSFTSSGSDAGAAVKEEVRAVLEAHRITASTTEELVSIVESQGGARAFLFGSDKESLDALQRQLRETESSIERVSGVLDGASNVSASVSTELETQMSVLKEEQEELQAFIEDQQSRFSLFGWLTRLLGI